MEYDDEPDMVFNRKKTPKFIKYPCLLDPEFADRDLHELPPKKCEPSQCLIHGKRFPCGIKDLRSYASPPANRTPGDSNSTMSAPYYPPPPLNFWKLSQATQNIILKQTELLDLVTLSYGPKEMRNLIMKMKRKVKWILVDPAKLEIYIKEDGCTCWIEKRVKIHSGDNGGAGYVDDHHVARIETLTAAVYSETHTFIGTVYRLLDMFGVQSSYLKMDWEGISNMSPWGGEKNLPFDDLLVIGDGTSWPGTTCLTTLKRRKIWRNVIFEGVFFQEQQGNDDVKTAFFRQFLENQIHTIIFRDSGVSLKNINCFIKLWLLSTNTALRKLTFTHVPGEGATSNQLIEGLTQSNDRISIARGIDGEYKLNDDTLKPLHARHLTRQDGVKASIVLSELHHNTKSVTFLIHVPEVEESESGADLEVETSDSGSDLAIKTSNSGLDAEVEKKDSVSGSAVALS